MGIVDVGRYSSFGRKGVMLLLVVLGQKESRNSCTLRREYVTSILWAEKRPWWERNKLQRG